MMKQDGTSIADLQDLEDPGDALAEPQGAPAPDVQHRRLRQRAQHLVRGLHCDVCVLAAIGAAAERCLQALIAVGQKQWSVKQGQLLLYHCDSSVSHRLCKACLGKAVVKAAVGAVRLVDDEQSVVPVADSRQACSDDSIT